MHAHTRTSEDYRTSGEIRQLHLCAILSQGERGRGLDFKGKVGSSCLGQSSVNKSLLGRRKRWATEESLTDMPGSSLLTAICSYSAKVGFPAFLWAFGSEFL